MGETTTRPLSADRLRTLAGAADAEADDMAERGEIDPLYHALRDDAREARVLADVLAALTPEVVAAARSARSYRWPHAGPEERAALDAGVAALDRLHPEADHA